ncbi:orotate phosphoribosyltransferase [Mangrovibacillus cuniculi]|uniref:Orotate phosphoribosyltransferase n=1 Tax=Mangrovibacillus cuniculi TaxID=2593652 RepID=A0A7S8CAI1_9BACI|nr:orotate phosphoribosyltransferase [Mangrovibacillus cuniculi]QPC46286.1 orotate phosphoribosyltransferase [Mangrovibacillus cuniculi]
MNAKVELASIYIECGAIAIDPINPFTWSSGLRSPIYCDNRKLLGYPKERNQIIHELVKAIQNSGEEIDVIAGCATAGIPHAAWVSEQLQLPMAYVRGEKKAHGRGQQIEGADVTGKRVLVLEDLISTGKSVAKVLEAITEAGGKPVVVWSLMTYELEAAQETFAKWGVPVHSLLAFSDLYPLVKESLSEEAFIHLQSWSKNPVTWDEVYRENQLAKS